MIIGAHSILYSKDAEADRRFLRDVLGLPSVDVGEGWLIFGLPPAEVAVHPSDDEERHEFYFMVDDVGKFVAELEEKETECSPIQEMGWGILTEVTMPGGGKVGVYQPRHARPESAGMSSARTARTEERGSGRPAGQERRGREDAPAGSGEETAGGEGAPEGEEPGSFDGAPRRRTRPAAMTRGARAAIAAAAIAGLGVTAVRPCTTVELPEEGRPVVAYNYDFHPSEGLLLVNKRETSKRSRVDPGGVRWTAAYGSVTFNQFGRDNPTTGMNERGLMASLMWLEGSRYPDAGDRPAAGILEWIQYNLDTRADVAEVVAGLDAVRPASDTPLHFFFADAKGDAAVVEFLDGEAVVHRGSDLPVRALANSRYDASLEAWRASLAGQSSASDGSLDRFIRGAGLAARGSGARQTGGDPIARAFEILKSVAQPGLTRWSVVYDLAARSVSFRTDRVPAIRTLSLRGLDLACASPVGMLDLTAPGKGDARADLRAYSGAANARLLRASFAKTPFLAATSDETRDRIAAWPETASTCGGTGAGR